MIHDERPVAEAFGRHHSARHAWAAAGGAAPGPWAFAARLCHHRHGVYDVLRYDGDAVWVDGSTGPLRVSAEQLARHWRPVWPAPIESEGAATSAPSAHPTAVVCADGPSDSPSPDDDAATVAAADPGVERPPGPHVVGPCFTGESAAEYHRRERGVASAGLLKILIDRTPAHADAWYDGADDGDSPALAFGRALHSAVLTPDLYAREYAVEPDFGDCRRAANKAARDEWRAANAGRESVSADAAATIRAMEASLLAHPLGRRLLQLPGECEATRRWVDPNTGVRCKARIDKWIEAHGGVVLDLKSTQSASPEAFGKSAATYGYHVQAAHYLAATEGRPEGPARAFVLLCVEKTPPYAVAVYQLDADALTLGAELRAEALDVLAQCVESGRWPGFEPKITTLALPGWAWRSGR